MAALQEFALGASAAANLARLVLTLLKIVDHGQAKRPTAAG